MSAFVEMLTQVEVPGDPESSAVAMVKALRLSKRQSEVLLDLIVDGCRRHDRNRVRLLEFEAFQPSPAAPAGGSPVAVNREQLMRETFTLGDGRRVAWATATVDDHRARVEFLQRFQVGLQRTIDRHLEIIERLVANGATCLDELEGCAA